MGHQGVSGDHRLPLVSCQWHAIPERLFSFPWCALILRNGRSSYWKARRRDCKRRWDVTWALSRSPRSVSHRGPWVAQVLGILRVMVLSCDDSGKLLPDLELPESLSQLLPSTPCILETCYPTWLSRGVCFSGLHRFIMNVIISEKVLKSSREEFFKLIPWT